MTHQREDSPEARIAEIRQQWRQALYPHIEPEVFDKFLADLSAEGWDDTRAEVRAVLAITDPLSRRLHEQAQEIERLRSAFDIQQRKEQSENRFLELRERAEAAERELAAVTAAIDAEAKLGLTAISGLTVTLYTRDGQQQSYGIARINTLRAALGGQETPQP